MPPLLPLLALLALLPAALALPPARTDVCILGGGSSGTHLAFRAAEAGRSVAIFEPNDYLGGHCRSLPLPASRAVRRAVPLAVVLVVGDARAALAALYRRFAVPLLPVEAAAAAAAAADPPRAAKLVDFSSGQVLTPPPPSSADVAAALAAARRFAALYKRKYFYYETNATYPDVARIPKEHLDELSLPFQAFLLRHDLLALAPFVDPLLLNGIGSRYDVPTFYALKVFNPRTLPAVLPAFKVQDVGLNDSSYFLVQGCSGVYSGMADFITAASRENTIMLNTDIVRVRRFAHRPKNPPRLSLVTVRSKGASASKTFACRAVVGAFPQQKTTLRSIMKLTRAERRAFGQLTWDSYYSTVWKVRGIFKAKNGGELSISQFNASSDRAPDLSVRFPATVSLSTLLTDDRRNISYVDVLRSYAGRFEGGDDSVVKTLRQELRRVQRPLSDSTRTGIRFKAKPVFVDGHLYRLRPKRFRLVVQGLYNRLYRLQGIRGMFYVGALYASNNQNTIWQYNEQVLEKNILPYLKRFKKTA